MTAALFMFFLSAFNPALLSQTIQNDLNQKLMMGYQGWFMCRGDGSAAGDWRHWFRSSTNPSADQLNIDNWPDMSEYTQTYATNLTYQDGSAAKLFSAYNESTTMTHFKWLKEYNIYGVYLQRFLGEAVNDSRFFLIRNHVLQNAINASQTYDRHFALMYDITGVPEDGFYDKLVKDWQYLVDTYDLANKPGYVKQNGMPVVAIWGMGFTHNEVTAETAQAVISYFHTAAPKYRAYIVGGVPGQWRTLDGDSWPDPLWATVYRSMDMISPWTVGRYNKTSVDGWKTRRIVPDLAECAAKGVDYMPVIFPGGSWFNQTGRTDSSRINDNPRDGGNLYLRQAYNAISARAQFIYVAMFDEVDEGTAMFKLAPNDAAAPAQGTFVTLDEDGYNLPSDWYLRLAGESQKMLDNTIPLSSDMPIIPPKIPVTDVTVSLTTATIVIGGSRQLRATVTPAKAYNKTIIWNTSDAGVAGVNVNGKVTGVAVGTATITVTAEDGGLQAVCVITVVEGTPVKGVTISPANATIDVSATLQLTAVITPADAFNKKVTWSTSDAAIATVDTSGLVTAVAEGKAIIKAKTEDGAKTAGSRITVNDISQTPFGDAPHEIPGTIEAEDYDNGGEGVAYHDLDVANQGGQYRLDEGVDIENCSEGGYNVGWINAGEWLEYTVNVAATGRHAVDALVATQVSNAKFHIEFGGINKTGVLDVPNTEGWQIWEFVSKTGISLNAGVQVMRVFRESDGANFNLDSFAFGAASSVQESPSAPTESSLYPVFPNPFNQSTVIRYEVPQATQVRIVIFNIKGELVRELVNLPHQAGYYELPWDGLNSAGSAAASGEYLLHLRTDDSNKIQKVILLR